MKTFSNIKFNIVLIVAIFVIASFFGVKLYFSASSSGAVNADPSSPSDEQEIELPNNKSDTTTSTQPVFKDGIEAALYGLEQLGHLDFYCVQTNYVDAAGVGSVQVYMDRYRHRNHDVLLSWSTNSTKIISAGKYFQSNYSNSDHSISKKTTNYNFEQKTYNFTNEEVSGDPANFTEFLYFDDHAGINNFFIDFDSTTARVGYFDKSKKDVYEVKIILNQSQLNDCDYAAQYKKQTDQFEMKKLNLTFTLDKKTGYILKILVDEEYAIGAYGLWAECKSTIKQVYNYNIDTKPYILKYTQEHFGLYQNL